MFSVFVSFLFVSIITYGATTIGSNINTGGALTVTGLAIFNGNATTTQLTVNGPATLYGATSIGGAITATSTLNVTGLTTLGNASTTNLSLTGNLWINGNATTTSQGNIQGQGILTMLGTGTSTYAGGLQTTALNITSATASSTFANGIILSKGCFLMPDGTCAGAGGGSGTINSGTTGQLSYYAGSGTTLTATSSLFIHSNQNIGIGTTTPNWLLQVAGTRPFLTLSDISAGTDQKHWFLSSQGGNFYVGTSSDAYATSTISALTINSNSRVGVGTTTPFEKFAVQGGIGADYLTISGGTNATSTFGTGGINVGNGQFVILKTSGQVGIGTAGTEAKLEIFDTYNSAIPALKLHQIMGSENYYMEIDSYIVGVNNVGYKFVTNNLSTSVNAMVITGNGNVGIGTTSPTEQLSVSGRLFVGGTGTSTIQNNLYVMGTLRSTVSYVGDLIFSNNFKFIETPPNAKVQSLFLQNQTGESIFKINENGKVVVKEIEAEIGKFNKEVETQNIKSQQGNFEKKLKTKELCLDDVCISKKELKELLELKKK